MGLWKWTETHNGEKPTSNEKNMPFSSEVQVWSKHQTEGTDDSLQEILHMDVRGLMFHHDNALPHTARLALKFLVPEHQPTSTNHNLKTHRY